MIGIDISDKSVKMVQLAKGSRKLKTYCAADMPEGAMDNGLVQDTSLVEKVLLQVMTQCQIGPKVSDVAVVSIPETKSFLRVIELPEMQDDEVDEAIRWEVAQHIPFNIDSVYVDWQALENSEAGSHGSEGRREIQVAATQKQVVDALHAVMQVLNMDIAAFELESQAIARAIISSELRQRRGILLIDIGASATNVVIHDHGAMRFTATLQRGIDQFVRGVASNYRKWVAQGLHTISEEQRTRLQEVMLPTLDELAVEVRGIVEFYNSIDSNHEVEEVIVTGGGSNMPGLEQAFLKLFPNVHVHRGNPWVNVLPREEITDPPMDLRESVRFTTAIGLALRKVLV